MIRGKEFEAKFLLPDMQDFRERLLAKGARVHISRLLERNIRYDTPDHRLSANFEVLRLRQARRITLTYKRSHTSIERTEFELEVDDFQIAESLLHALGYQVIFTYEKFRETFALDPTKIMLDELPFGYFVEIEGTSTEAVKKQATFLGLDWVRRVKPSYFDLFATLRQRRNLPFTDATFENFTGLSTITPADLGLEDAIQILQAGTINDEQIAR